MIITVATGNPHKLEEIRAINPFDEIKFEVVKGDFDPDENGATFAENATIKAKAAAKISGNYALADDTGLCIKALNGAPGLFSARYAPTPKERIERVLKELEGKTDRSAEFVCFMTLVAPSGEVVFQTEGHFKGEIAFKPAGNEGFGYDPIFYLPEYGKTVAELEDAVKNKISHRAGALLPMTRKIVEKFGLQK